jgi:catechol 2,3-dioxygenase-like lactoylglutathione lyase family enzyme
MDLKLELVILPVTDVDRAKSFYADRVGFTVDVDHDDGAAFRIVQLTPPGSACSIAFGRSISTAEPGSVQGLHLVVTDIEAARAEMVERGVEVGEIYHFGAQGQEPGVHPDHEKYNSFAEFADPDGNRWVLQEVPPEPAAS